MRLIGPALGGALLGLFGLASVVMVDSGSYLFSALMIGLLQIPKPVVVAGVGATMEGAASRWVRFWRDWLGGLHYVRKDRLLRSILVITSIASVAAGVVNPLLQVFVQDELHAGAAALGLMLSATGVGTLFTGLVLGKARVDWPLGRLASLGQLLFGGMLFVTFLSRSAPVVILLSAPVGVAIASSIGFRTLLQASAEDQYRGRVLGAASATGALLRLLGEGMGSLLVAPVGLIPVLDAACGLYILAGLAGLLLLPPATEVVPAEVE